MRNKVLLIILCVCVFVLVACLSTYAILKSRIKAYLVDGNSVAVQVQSEYKDPGIVVKLGKKVISKNKYKVKITGKYNTNKIGMYKLNYHTRYFNKDLDLVRIIKVFDDVKPVLTLNQEIVYEDYCTKKYNQEIKYTAIDNYDGDLTSKVEIKEQDDKITYSVKDSSGNKEEKEVLIDYGTKPSNIFSLNGSKTTYVVVNTSYNEKGASYTDGCGNKINKDIKVKGTVDTSKIGEYEITYEVEGENPITRKVVVRERPHKTIYLTFDDGPGANTKKVLDVLDKYNVKATFFVTNQFPKYQDLIKKEYDSGHAVGVHTLTHRWDVYDSVESYISDFDQMNEIIKNQTGSYTKIFRFPGGSGNTVSKSHSKGIVTTLVNEMTNRGYVYFDWNLSSGDASTGKVTSEKIIKNVLNNVDNCSSECVILFHDYKSVTANAIEPIVKELVERGYDFSSVSENGPIVHAKVKN